MNAEKAVGSDVALMCMGTSVVGQGKDGQLHAGDVDTLHAEAAQLVGVDLDLFGLAKCNCRCWCGLAAGATRAGPAIRSGRATLSDGAAIAGFAARALLSAFPLGASRPGVPALADHTADLLDDAIGEGQGQAAVNDLGADDRPAGHTIAAVTAVATIGATLSGDADAVTAGDALWALLSAFTLGALGTGLAGWSALTLEAPKPLLALRASRTGLAPIALGPKRAGFARLTPRADITLRAGKSLFSTFALGATLTPGPGRALRADLATLTSGASLAVSCDWPTLQGVQPTKDSSQDPSDAGPRARLVRPTAGRARQDHGIRLLL